MNANRTQCVEHSCENANYIYNPITATCEACSLGSCAIGGVCAVCAPGYYTPQAGAACTSCQGVEGLVCSGGLASVTSGYWAFTVDGVDGDGSPSKLFQTASCPPDFCPGSLLQQESIGNSSTSFIPSSSVELCTPPRLNTPSNVLCGECEEGYIAWGSRCVPCSGANGGLIFAGVLISFLFVAFLYRTSDQAAAGAVAILLFFAQTAALEVGSVTQWLSWVQFLNLGVHSSSACLAPLNAYDQMLFSLFVPVILIAEVAVLALLHYSFHQRHKHDTDSASTDPSATTAATVRATSPSVQISILSQQTAARLANSFSWNKYVACLMSVLLFCYTQVAVTSFQYLYCVDVGSARVVFSSPTIDCQSAQYRAYLPAPILAVALYIVGFPLVVLTLLWVHKETLFVSVVASRASAADIKASLAGFFLRWSPLFQMFHPRAWFWQPLLLVRRSMYVLASVLLVQQPAARFMAFSFLNFGSLLFHLLVRPFDSDRLNYIESASYALLVSISIILGGTVRPYSDATQAVLLLMVVLPIAALFGYIVLREWQEFQLRKRSSGSESPVIDQKTKKDIEMGAPSSVDVNVDSSNESGTNGDLAEFDEVSPAYNRGRASSVVQPTMLDPSVPCSDCAQL